QAAVSEGNITIRDTDKQQQNVDDLSRDVENANGSIGPIFDKEKEQNRLKEAQLIGEIGGQAMDIARTQGKIIATKAANDKMQNVKPEDIAAAEKQWSKANPGQVPTAEDINQQIYQTAYNQAFNESGLGTGGAVQRAMQAATAAVQGLSGGNMAAALANGAAPYITKLIADSLPNDPASRTLAHAAVNAALAAAQGNNALVGAGGAVTGELIGMIAINAYGKPVSELSETEKQTVSALATLAAGLAGGLIGDSTADTVAGAQAGKTVVENNAVSLPSGMMNYGQAAASWNQFALDNNLSPEQTLAGLNSLAKGELPEGANIAKVIVGGYQDGVLIAGAWYLGPAATVGKVVAGSIIAEIANGSYQWYDLNQPGNANKTWDYWSSASAAITGGLAPGRDIGMNTGIALGGSILSDGLNAGGQFGAGTGAFVGGIFGMYAPFPGEMNDIFSSVGSEIISNKIKESVNEKK
ncbi:VENN motif pre-toxin domain-containing protein, partial [Yersinia kristensenii]|uniref:VENN motif pre-toxin domain-containing protein n=1 Tax=Yersinia kristensenii TaxID=28152 RepID=UPI0028531E9E